MKGRYDIMQYMVVKKVEIYKKLNNITDIRSKCLY